MTAAVGDTTFLADYLVNAKLYAVVVPPDPTGTVPLQEFIATFEVNGDQGTLTMAAIIGPRGPAGLDMFVLTLQTDDIDDPSELPQTLRNTDADTGKFWVFDDVDGSGTVIGSSGYIWYGGSYRRIQLGTPGPPGPVPIITPTVALVDPHVQESEVVTGGTALYPTLGFQLAVPPGPAGPAAAIAAAPDVDLSTPPVAGDILGFTGRTTTGTFLTPPSHLTALIHGSGGTLPAGTYTYQATATNAAGETTASLPVTVSVTGATTSVSLSWAAVPGATGTRIYRQGTAGSVLLASLASTAVSYTDTGGAGSAGAPPSTNSASVAYPLWVPVSISQLIPSPFSMPESAFTSFSGISARAAIGSFALPPQPFPWTPIVWGHLGAFGVELSTQPLLIGCEVLLGDPTTGQEIGRGFGNSFGEVNVMPHYSTPSIPSDAITPENGLGVVPANHTNPAQGTIYFNLYNDGAEGVYFFNPTDAQGFCMVMPVAPTAMGTTRTIQTRRVNGGGGQSHRRRHRSLLG